MTYCHVGAAKRLAETNAAAKRGRDNQKQETNFILTGLLEKYMKNIIRRYGFAKAKPNKMKGRKNIFKIAITSVLSATMCLTGALAVKSVMPAKAFAETTVNTSSIVDKVVYSGDGTAVEYGTYQDVVTDTKSYTGLKLTGGTGAQFNLGTIDLKKSYWNGVDMTYGADAPFSGVTVTTDMQAKDDVTAENPRDYNKFLYDTTDKALSGAFYPGTDTYANFIAFAFAPHVDRYDYPHDNGSTTGTPGVYNLISYNELKALTIRLTDVNDSGNYVDIVSQEQQDSNTNSRDFGTNGNNQKYAGMRKKGTDGPRLYNSLRVSQSANGGPLQVPYELCYSQNWDATSETDRNPALYSPNGSGAAPSIGGTWLIRKYGKSSYANAGCLSDNAWNGFSSGKVNVTVTFNNVRTISDKNDDSKTNEGITSLIVTSLGGYDLTQTQQTLTDADYFDISYNDKNVNSALKGEEVTLYAPVKSSVITSTAILGSYVEIYNGNNELESTVTFNNATETYAFRKAGAYTLKWYAAADSLIKTTTVKSVTSVVDVDKDIASKITSNTGSAAYIENKKQVSNNSLFSGIRLTGVTGSSFDLGTFKLDNNKMYWNGSAYDASSVVTDNGKYYSGKNNHNKLNGDASSYGSFFSYVYDTASTTFELPELKIRIEQVGKTSNYVQLYTGIYADGQGDNILFYAQGTNNTTNKMERNDGSGTYFANHLRTYKTGNVTRPIDLVWDNAKATIYANTTYGGGAAGGYGTWAIRQFNQPKEYYAAGKNGQDAYDSNKFSQWAGFDDGAELRCVVTFANSSAETSIIITSLGGVDLTNATYPADMTAETSDANGVAGVECNLLDSVWYTDGLAKVDADVEKVTVQKGDAVATEVAPAAAKTYRFADNGEYVVTYYDKFDQVIGTSTYTISALTANITVTGGEIRKADGTVVKSGDELSLDDVLTFVPTGSVQNSKTTIDFDVLKSLTVNGSAITAAEKQSEFTLNVADYISGATIDIVAVFDAEVNVYMTDSRKGITEQLVETLWASDGKYTFKGYESINLFIQSHFKELDDGSYDMLLGFGRYQRIGGVKTSIVNAPVLTKQYLSVVNPYNDYSALYKENYLEALYINVKTSYQVRVGVDESDSGLRMVTELKQADVDLYNFYNENGLGMTVRTNYTILNHLQEAKGKDFDIKTIKASDWMTGGWDPVPGQANTLGLYATGQDVDTTGKPLFYQYYSQSLKLMNRMVSGVSDGYIGYAVTLRNFNEANINQDYVFQSTWTVDGSTGGATGCVGYAKTAKMSTLATEVYNAAFGEKGGEYQYTVTDNGVTKYSKYNQNQIDWLRKMAGKA